jgi:hypothetical protein
VEAEARIEEGCCDGGQIVFWGLRNVLATSDGSIAKHSEADLSVGKSGFKQYFHFGR